MKPTNIIIATSLTLLLVSFWNRNELPRNIDYQPGTLNEPSQAPTPKEPFNTKFNDVDYLIEPEYDYDLQGVVVSFRHHDKNSRMHLQANDHLNMMDVCVIWGGNATNRLIHKFDFWNGVFTCNVKTSDQEAWESFSMNELSNNHLISDNEYIREDVSKIRIGDQIRVRGWLAGYKSPLGGIRGTSTTRDDTGDGACETIFVSKFDIVQPATSYWRISMYASMVLLIGGLLFHFRQPYRPHKPIKSDVKLSHTIIISKEDLL